ncbi:MAG: hypothetical protein IJM14_05570 [Lachnospiraceae bacterium]|nr:hypothetical protein [Lachnospiraceae bacterium]
MLYFSFGLIIFVIILNLAGVGLYIKEGRSLKDGLPGAYVLVRCINEISDRVSPEKKELSLKYYDEIYVGENPEEKRVTAELGIAGLAMGIAFFSALLYLLLNFSDFYESGYVDALTRPENGSKSVELLAEYEGESYRIPLVLEKVRPREEKARRILDEFKEKLADYVLGKNASADKVMYDLCFDTRELDPDIEVYWSSSDVNIVGLDGKVKADKLAERKSVRITAVIGYYELKDEFVLTLTVWPKSKETETEALLRERMEGLLENRKYSEEVALPEKINGSKVSFKEYKENNSAYVLLLGILAAFLMLPYGMSLRQKKRKERNIQLIIDYPDVVSKLALLLESGLTIRLAFERIALDYESRRKSLTGKKKKNSRRYAYEEMLRCRNEMMLGGSEAEAYGHFGRRCQNMYYIRLSALLCQNLKKGSESLLPSLYQEIAEARNERQAEIRRRGEEISVKLLVPMAGMFALVLAVLLVPAFLSI